MDTIAQARIAVADDRTVQRAPPHMLTRRIAIRTGLAGALMATVTAGYPLAREVQLTQGTVTSRDGTQIAFDRYGTGPALILVGGALSERSAWAALGGLLSAHFTIFAFDRRGRGDSGDTQPYAVGREIEDIEALIDQAGGTAFVHGQSAGAVLSLEATTWLPAKVLKLSLYEPPFIIDDSRPPPPEGFADRIDDLLAADRRDEAVSYWMTDIVGAPDEMVAEIKQSPAWSSLAAVAHTLPYDIAVLNGNMSGNPLPVHKWTSVTAPVLVMDGGASPGWIRKTAQALAGVLPNAQHLSLAEQTHNAAPEVLAPILERFFRE